MPFIIFIMEFVMTLVPLHPKFIIPSDVINENRHDYLIVITLNSLYVDEIVDYLSSKLGKYDITKRLYSMTSRLSISYKKEQHLEVIDTLNYLAEKYKIHLMTLYYIANDEHRKILNDLENSYKIIGSNEKEFRKFKYYTELYDDFISSNNDKHKILADLNRIGFKNDINTKKFVKDKSSNYELIFMDLYYDSPVDVFPLKCRHHHLNINIEKVFYVEFTDIVPMVWEY